MEEKEKTDFSLYDAIVIPGCGGPRDGLDPVNSLPVWVRSKLDWFARQYDGSVPVVLLSAGTFHKAGSLDVNGRNIQEATGMTLYLEQHGIDPSMIYEENASYDTVGNAFYLRAMHTDVRSWHRLLVVTNEFHEPRVKLTFDWVFGLPSTEGSESPYRLTYLAFPDDKITPYDRCINARRTREGESLARMQSRIGELDLKSLGQFHHWMFSEHDLYCAKNRKNLVLKKIEPAVDEECIKSY